MSVAGLAIDMSNRNPIVLLRDPAGRRQVPIWVDHAQAHNILSGIQSNLPIQPSCHDLMITLMKAGRLDLEKIIIHSIEKDTFKAILKINIKREVKESSEGKEISILEIDARPSDAIALAVRTKCSIWMLEKVVAEASIPVDAEADEEDKVEFHRFIENVSPAALVKHLKNQIHKPNQDPGLTDEKNGPQQ